MSSPAKLFECLEYEDEVLRALALHQYMHCKLGVIFPADDDDRRQLVIVPVFWKVRVGFCAHLEHGSFLKD